MSRRNLLALAFAGAALVAAPRAEAQPAAFVLTLTGPGTFLPGVHATYSGRLTFGDRGMPSQLVDVLVDDRRETTVVTQSDGSWSATLTFAGLFTHEVEAVYLHGSPFETRSAALPVTPAAFRVEIVKAGTGTGRVISVPAGIDCGADCSENFQFGKDIRLTALPDAGTVFDGWSGDCVGSAQCLLVVEGPMSVVATFRDVSPPPPPVLSRSDPPPPSNVNTPRLFGVAESGSTVRIYTGACSGNPAATDTAAVLASPGLEANVANDSVTEFRATATDAAGNVSDCSAPFTYIEDSQSPPPPLLFRTVPSSPANNNAPRVQGSAEPGSGIVLYTAGECSGSVSGTGLAAELAGAGVAVTVPDDANTPIRANATDAAGNTSACSGAILYVEDSTAPAPPSLTRTIPASPANHNGPVVTGSAEPGSTVSMYRIAGCSGSPAATDDADVLASPGFVLTVADDSATSFSATSTDAAGNTSACSAPIQYVEDSTAPPPPLLTGARPPSPANDNFPGITGTAEPGSSVRVLAADCSTLAGSGSAAELASSGIEVSVGDDTVTTFRATATDAAENTSACAAGVEYVEDSTAPAPPVLTETRPASPSNDNNPRFLGTAEIGATIQLYANWDCSGSSSATGGEADFTSTGLSVMVDDDVVTYVFGTATDAAGNTSACSVGFGYREDSTPPDPPTLLGISPNSPANDNMPRLFGSSSAEAVTIEIRTDPGCTSDAPVSVPSDALGTGVAVEVPDDSTTTFYANAIDAAGNRSACSNGITYREDSTPPSAPTLASTSPPSPANDNQPEMIGSAEPGSLVRIYADLTCTGGVVDGGSAEELSSGGISIDVFDNTTTAYRARAIDAAGNPSPCSSPLEYTEDSRPPAFAGGGAAAATGAGTIEVSWNAASDTVSGAAQIAYDLCVATSFGACTSSFNVTSSTAPGASSHTLTGLSEDGRYVVVVRARDQAGNRDGNLKEVAARTFGRRIVRAVATAEYSSCALVTDGTVRCWGENGYGQLGDGTNTFRTRPVTVLGVSGAVDVGAGGRQGCAVLSDGTVRCWGRNDQGQLGDGTTTNRSTPVAVGGLNGVTSVALGANHTCALLASGGVGCWGDNLAGQLGDGTTTDRLTPVAVTGLPPARGLSAGSLHTCALLQDGGVRCWGNNSDGELGDGSRAFRSTPVAVAGLPAAASVDAGSSHTCVILADGTLRCWGDNGFGQLGDGTTTDRLTPIVVGGLPPGRAVSAGGHRTCVLTSGDTRCWGRNAFGAVGDGTTTDRSTPVSIGLAGARTISADGLHSCAVAAGGAARCWGLNGAGQVGDGSTTQRTTPVPVDGPVAAAGSIGLSTVYRHACSAVSDGSILCWGSNDFGELGDGTTANRDAPVLSALSGDAVSAGSLHTCSLTHNGGTAQCVGSNERAQLGDGTTFSRISPVPVNGLTGATAIAPGLSHTCALMETGTVRCWGANDRGQLGDGSLIDRLNPVSVQGLSGVVAIAAGGRHNCALLAEGAVRCWGDNQSGQLGDGSFVDRATPVAVPGLSGVAGLAGGNQHTCASLADGTGRCWGQNTQGQLGDGTIVTRGTPVSVTGLSGALSLTAGDSHSCALLANGIAHCWGNNFRGQLGDGTTTSRNAPAAVGGSLGLRSVSAGGNFTCGEARDGGLLCWGGNELGQVGDGTYDYRTLPTPVSRYP